MHVMDLIFCLECSGGQDMVTLTIFSDPCPRPTPVLEWILSIMSNEFIVWRKYRYGKWSAGRYSKDG